MEHPIRKTLSLLLALSLALVILYVSVMAADGNGSRYSSSNPTGETAPLPQSGTCGENLTWDYTADGTLTISGIGPMIDFESSYDAPWYNLYNVQKLVIEEGVTHIGNYAFCNFGLYYEADTDLILPDSLVSIGDYAFEGLDGISTVHFGSNLESIGENSFNYCSNLRTLNFPASLKQIGNYAFSQCSGITRMVFNGDAPAFGTDPFYPLASSVFYPANNATWTDDVMQQYGGILKWVEGAPTETPVLITGGECGFNNPSDVIWSLYDNGHLAVTGSGEMEHAGYFSTPWYSCRYAVRSASFGEGVTNVGSYAFYQNFHLEKVTLSGTVEVIEAEAFSACTALVTVEMCEGLVEVSNDAFNSCNNLTNVTFPSTLTTIGEYAFYCCGNLQNVTFPKSLTTIGEYAFAYCYGLTEAILPDALTTIDNCAFYQSSNIKKITMSDKVTTIGTYAFSSTGVESIVLPADLEVLGYGAFQYCYDLTSVTLNDKLTTINAEAFANTGITHVYIPSSVKTIDNHAFGSCYDIVCIVFTGDAPTLGSYALSDYGPTLAYYPAGNDTWAEAIQNDYYGSIIWVPGTPETNPMPLASGTCGDNLTWELNLDRELVISGTGAMVNFDYDGTYVPWSDVCHKVGSIIVSDGITSIGELAFESCYNATDLHIGKDVSSIASNSLPFSLETITLSSENKTYSVVGSLLCDNTKASVIYCSRVFAGVCTIPEGITTIESCAFQNCYDLTGINLPSTLTSINDFAFYYCGLTEVSVPEGVTHIGTSAFESCPIQKLELPSTVQTIGESAFVFTMITELTLPEDLVSLGASAFNDCYDLTKLTINTTAPLLNISASFNGYTKLATIEVSAGNNTYRAVNNILYSKDMTILYLCAPATSGTVTIPEGVVEISVGAFDNCDSITGINFPASTLKVIGEFAFANSDGIISITIPNSVTTMGTGVFSNCYNLETVTLSNSLTKIPDEAFSCCYYLSEILIPTSVTTIGYDAFYYCDTLDSIVIPASVTTIEDAAFSQCYNLTTVTFLGDAPDFNGMSIFSSSYPNIYYPANNDTWTPRVMLNYNGSPTWFAQGSTEGATSVDYGSCGSNSYMHLSSNGTLVIYGYGPLDRFGWDIYPSVITSVIIDNGITSIPTNAFSDLPNLTEITLPQSITYIGSNVFANSGITSITFEGEVPEMKEDSFAGATATVYYPANSTTWTADVLQNYGGEITWSEGDAMKSFSIVPLYPTLALEDEVKYNIYFSLKDQDLVNIEEMGLLTFLAKPAVGGIENANGIIPGAVFDGTNYMVTSNGIPAKELGDALYFQIYVKLSDGSYVYTKAFTFNAVSYVKSVLASSGSASLKKVCVSLMNYGASAQVQFGYKTDSLMNSFLTAEQQALVSAYSSDMTAPIVKADSSKAGPYVYTAAGFTSRLPSVSLEGAFALNYYFVPAKTVDTTMILYYWTAEDYKAAATLAPENASGSMVMGPNEAGQYWADCSGIAAKGLDETLYVTAVYQSDGETYCSGVLACTVSALCNMQMQSTNPAIAALAEDILVYGYYAKSHFGA